MTSKNTFKPLTFVVAFSFSILSNVYAQSNQNMLQKYSYRPCVDILRDLYLLKQRASDGEEIVQPLITVMPGSKLPITGFLVDFKDDKEQRGIVLESQGSTDLVFLELYWITGVSIQDAERVAPYLIEMSKDDIKTSCTRLDIKNKIKKESDKLAQKISPISFSFAEEGVPENGQQLYLTNLFISDLSMALIEISKTDLGKEAVKENIKAINIKSGSALDIKLAQGTLTVFHDFKRSYTTNSARQILIDKIYNLL